MIAFFWWPIFAGCVSFRVGNLYYSALSKKSPTRPTERTPNPEYLITPATSGSVGKVPFNFGFQQDPTYHEPYLLVGSDQSKMPKGLNLICCNISLQWHKLWCTWFRTSTKQWGCKTGVLFMAIAGMIFHLIVIIWHKLTYITKTSPYNSKALYIEFRFYASTTPPKMIQSSLYKMCFGQFAQNVRPFHTDLFATVFGLADSWLATCLATLFFGCYAHDCVGRWVLIL